MIHGTWNTNLRGRFTSFFLIHFNFDSALHPEPFGIYERTRVFTTWFSGDVTTPSSKIYTESLMRMGTIVQRVVGIDIIKSGCLFKGYLFNVRNSFCSISNRDVYPSGMNADQSGHQKTELALIPCWFYAEDSPIF